jgi:AcrR family transcriptional regulator
MATHDHDRDVTTGDAATPGPRRRHPHGTPRRRTPEFAAHGFEGASTRAIATAAGTHQPQINYHFDSKDELWKAAVDHLFDRLDQAVSEQLGETVPGWDSP